MFDWVMYIELAGILIERNDEESLRTAVSRLYYGFFGIVRRYLVNVKRKYYLMFHNVNVHLKVFDELNNSNDDTEEELAQILNLLRTLRNNADYDDANEFNKEFFENFLDIYKDELKMGFEALKYLRRHPNY